jgi:hypothetical protein
VEGSRQRALLAEYGEVNQNFRLLTDIRFKLLAFLPLLVAIAAAAAEAVHNGGDRVGLDASTFAFSLFGLFVTLALATYNARNDQIYLWLVDRGTRIERELGLPDGSFAHRPNGWLDVSFGIGRWPVGHARSITAMYMAATALWLGVCLVAAGQLAWGAAVMPFVAYLAAAALALITTIAGTLVIRRQKKARRCEMREAARDALGFTEPRRTTRDPEDITQLPNHEEFTEACLKLMGRDRNEDQRREELLKRLKFYVGMPEQMRKLHGICDATGDKQADADYLALLVDLPSTLLIDGPQRR